MPSPLVSPTSTANWAENWKAGSGRGVRLSVLTNSLLTLAWVFRLPESTSSRRTEISYNLFILLSLIDQIILGNNYFPPCTKFSPPFRGVLKQCSQARCKSFINWKLAKCVSPSNGKNLMQRPNEVNGFPWTALGQFKQCYILVHCQASRWWQDSHKGPKQLLKEGGHPCYPQMQQSHW